MTPIGSVSGQTVSGGASVTFALGATGSTAAFRLSSLARLPDGSIHLARTGELVRHYTIEVATNLRICSVLTNFTSSGDTSPIVDAAALTQPERFYRARVETP